MSQGHLDTCSRTLVDAVFHAQEQQLLQAFRQRLEQTDRRTLLAQVCGVHDEALLDHLLRLNLEPEAVAGLAVIPLIVVAWADRSIQAAERQAILQAAQTADIPPKDSRYPVLEHWLKDRPGPELLDAWKQYLAAVCRQLGPEEILELKHDLLDRARQVASAAGGLLGFGNRISAKEQAALDALEAAFA
jgi:hypothetical protein